MFAYLRMKARSRPGHTRLLGLVGLMLLLTWSSGRWSSNDHEDAVRHSIRWNVIPRSAQMVADAGKVNVRGTVVVTGGGGNIGKHLIRRLLATNTKLIVIDPIFHRDELEAIHADYPRAATHGLLDYIPGDVRNTTLLDQVFEDDTIDGVINLAAVSRVLWCLENKMDCEAVNVDAVGVVLNAMRGNARGKKKGLPWFVQASSREVYGDTKVGEVVRESDETVPSNIYGETKLRAEKVIRGFMDEVEEDRGGGGGLQAIALRLSNVYGGEADHRERLVPAITAQAISHRPIQMVGGDQFLDMVHIDDVVDAFILAIHRLDTRNHRQAWLWGTGRSSSTFEQFNVAAGRAVSAIELVRKVLTLTGSASPVQTIPGDERFPARYEGSTVKASQVLGYTAKVGIDEGLIRLVTAYYRQTEAFIENKRETKCQPRSYSNQNLVDLDGCTVNIVGHTRGELSYLALSGKTSDPDESWQWDWSYEPKPYEINVTTDNGGLLSARFGLQGKFSYDVVNVTYQDETFTDFQLDVDRTNGYVTIGLAGGKGYWLPPPAKNITTRITPKKPEQAEFRIIPICCKKPAPWPFMDEDPLAAGINDYRTEQQKPFTGSQHKTLCQRLSKAAEVVRGNLDRLAAYPRPYFIDQAPMPTGRPIEWKHRDRKACSNLCDHPTTCLDTGDCACVLSSCPALLRFPFASMAHVDELSYPPTTKEIDPNDDLSLSNLIYHRSWLSVLRPSASRYLSRNPSWPKVHVTELPPAVREHREEEWWKYDRFLPGRPGCFSADSVLERGLRVVNDSYSDDGFVFMPYFQGSLWYPNVQDWRNNALTNYLPPDFDESRWIVPFTHDWGICNTFLFDVFTMRSKMSSAIDIVRTGTAWSVMGDLNSNCYRFDQDVVIPPRACSMPKLVEAYGSLHQVRPARQRKTLSTFKASFMGTGSSGRHKMVCQRPFDHVQAPKLLGGTDLETIWDGHGHYGNYIKLLGDTIFCPLVRGTTGWASRMVDVIYAGCIPVVFEDQTHLAFWDILDWSKFSITVMEADLDHYEEILLGYTWEQIADLQANLMLIRDAFIYPLDDDVATQIDARGPLFFALHSTALTRYTKFPV